MGKLVLGLVAEAVFSGGSQRMTGMTITPTSPQVGDTITITHPGPSPVTVARRKFKLQSRTTQASLFPA